MTNNDEELIEELAGHGETNYAKDKQEQASKDLSAFRADPLKYLGSDLLPPSVLARALEQADTNQLWQAWRKKSGEKAEAE